MRQSLLPDEQDVEAALDFDFVIAATNLTNLAKHHYDRQLKMIAAKDNAPQLTAKEFFDWEEQQLEKHEYIDGQVYAMSGGSKNHSLISVRFITLFANHLEGSGCETGNSDLKVNIAETGNYTYPDVSITCDDRDKTTTQYITYPCLIV
jgi:Uma2 family endonuclease